MQEKSSRQGDEQPEVFRPFEAISRIPTHPPVLRRYPGQADAVTRSRESMVASKQGGRAERERLNQRAVQEAIRDKRAQQRADEKAARDRERDEKQAAREQAERYARQRSAEAASRTQAVQSRVEELGGVLVAGVKSAAPTGFESLRRAYVPAPFVLPVELAAPAPSQIRCPPWPDPAHRRPRAPTSPEGAPGPGRTPGQRQGQTTSTPRVMSAAGRAETTPRRVNHTERDWLS